VNVLETSLTKLTRALIRVALGFYFSRIERFHAERAPATGPVIFTANHPNSLTDAFVIGTSVPRKVHFVATAQLFRFKPLAWFLKQCGVIPINRVKDDPKAMRTVFDTFEACFQVLERDGAIVIFPEGITHDDPQLKTVKTGAARMALELEHRHSGKLGLQIVPVGLTFSAKEMYRSKVLVNYGEPIRIAEFVTGYERRRKESINELTSRIEQRIQALMLHLPQLEQGRLIEAVKRLYLDRLRLGNLIIKEPVSPRAEELMLTQAIAAAVEYTQRTQPERLTTFVRKLDHYENWLKRLKLSDEAIELFSDQKNLIGRSLGWATMGVLGLPIALYGWAHRLLPAALVHWAVNHFTKREQRKAAASTTAIIAGIVSFGVIYSVYAWVIHRWFGWPVSLWFALSLPVTGLIAHYYLRELGRLAAGLRIMMIFFRVPFVTRRLVAMRAALIAEIESLRAEYRRTLQPTSG
jgi:1-acyl-sn-glycerol-3-phosphate acyltransferase